MIDRGCKVVVLERAIINGAKKEEKIQEIEEEWISSWNEKFNIYFYGFGTIAQKSLEKIAANCNKFCNRINQIYIFDRDAEKYKKIESVSEQLKGQLDIIPYSKGEIEKKLKDKEYFNIFFLTAKIGKEQKNRYESSKFNIGLISEIAPLFPIDYNGLVSIVTNLPEILSYKLALDSNLKPEQIFGFDHVDKYRIDAELKRHLKAKENYDSFFTSTAFLIGNHERPICIFNKAKIFYRKDGEMREESIGPPTFRKEELDEIKNYAINKPKKLFDLAIETGGPPSDIETGGALNELLLGIIMNEYYVVNVSLPFKYDDFPYMYLELPVIFDKGIPYIFDEGINNLTQEDKREIYGAVQELWINQCSDIFKCTGLENKIGRVELRKITSDNLFLMINEKYRGLKLEKDDGDIFQKMNWKYEPKIKTNDEKTFRKIDQKFKTRL